MNDTPKTILVVEDNQDNSQLVEKILKHAGFACVVIDNGEEALVWCSQQVPSAVLMDISLPGMDGLEVTEKLREMEGYRDVPIVALTAHAMSGWDEKCRQAGCSDYISKPINPRGFRDKIEQLLSP